MFSFTAILFEMKPIDKRLRDSNNTVRSTHVTKQQQFEYQTQVSPVLSLYALSPSASKEYCH